MMKDKASIQVQAVLYRNGPEELSRALEALNNAAGEAAKAGYAVSLKWGDASPEPVFSDREWWEIKNRFSQLSEMEYLVWQKNTGYGCGNNLLAKEAETDYLLIMNPEILVSPRAIISLLDCFQAPETGIAEARQIPMEHPKRFDPMTGETAWASGACFLIPATLFRQLGGFDSETFFMYCEDVDLSWRIRMAGKKVIYQPLASVFHSRIFSVDGKYQPSATEMQYTVLSEALLAYKWSYPEFAMERIRMAVANEVPGSVEAREIFRRKEEAGELPSVLDPDHLVAKIIQQPDTGGMLFAEHRYAI